MNQLLTMGTPASEDITLGDLAQTYRRRRRVFWRVAGGTVALAAIYCMVCTPRYDGSAVIQVQRENPDSLGLDNIISGPEGSVDALNAALDLQTESEILQSDTLALKVIEDLNLEHTKDFEPHFNPITWALGLLSPEGVRDAPNASLEDAPVRRAHVLKVFSKNLKVKVDSGSRLIDIDYLSSDPKTAAAVVNKLVDGLTEYTFQTRLSATSQASNWLAGQLGALRKQSEQLESKVADLQKDMGVFSLGDNDSQGKPQVYSTVLDQLQQQTAALSAAEANRIMKGALYQVVKSGNADLISGLGGSSLGAASAGMNSSFTLIQTLRAQQATLVQQLAHDQAKYGTAYPALAEENASLQGINQSIQAEIGRLAERAKNDYQIAEQAEQSTRASYENAHKAADMLNDKSAEFTIARQEANDSRSLYQDLLKRLKEGGVLQGLRSSNITVVDPGRVPAKPKKPNVPLYLAIALVAGLFLGAGASLFIDVVDDKIQGVEELEQLHGAPLLGIMPFVKKGGIELEAMASPASPFTEAVRGLRTTLMLGKSSAPPRVLLVTSALPDEGKTTLAKSLAVLLAKQGRRVLLVEADLRRPRMGQDFDFAGQGGLSTILAGLEDGETGLGIAFTPDGVSSLAVLPAGPVPKEPAELIDSARMRTLVQTWRKQFDVVLLDGPPVLAVTDAIPLAGMADTTIMVARCGLTPRSSLRRAYQVMEEHVDRSRLRLVLNGVRPGSYAYQNYYGFSSTRPYGGDKRASV